MKWYPFTCRWCGERDRGIVPGVIYCRPLCRNLAAIAARLGQRR